MTVIETKLMDKMKLKAKKSILMKKKWKTKGI